MAASVRVTERGQNYIVYTFKLSYSLNLGNYLKIGLSDKPFENGTKSLPGDIKASFSPGPQDDINGEISLRVSNLNAGTTYTFYAFAQTPSEEKYFIIPNGDGENYISATTLPSSQIIYDVLCTKKTQNIEIGRVSLHLQCRFSEPQETCIFRISRLKDDFTSCDTVIVDTSSLSVNSYVQCVYELALPGSTYYVDVYGTTNVSDTITVHTPPNGLLVIDYNIMMGDEHGCSNFLYQNISSLGGQCLRLYLHQYALDYLFYYATFELKKDGSPIFSTHINKGDGYVTSAYTICTVNRDDMTGATSVVVLRPEAGTYTGTIRIYDQYGQQPVDENGNEICYTDTITITSNVRPDKFYWDSPKTSGGTYNLTANEWNRLTDNINQVLAYKNKPTRSFTTVYAGKTRVTADIFNEVLNVLNDVWGFGYSLAKTGKPILGHYFDYIQSDINSIE